MIAFKRISSTALILFVFCLGFLADIKANIKLPWFFSDNMVLQQQTESAIWGWAKTGAAVSVTTSWNKRKYTTFADAEGKWKLKVATPAAGGSGGGSGQGSAGSATRRAGPAPAP